MPKTVVITGGTSGIGHATALACARRGWAVVLGARGEQALAEVVRELEAVGGEALGVVCDVSRPDDCQRLAFEAVARFGRIDVWINNAAVAEWGYFEEMPLEDVRRVLEVDLLGPMYGARAALPHLRASGGTLINVASALADRAIPLLSTYCAAKAAVKAWTDSLRMELADSGAKVRVTLILPASIDTPFYRWGASRMGVRPRPISVLYTPAKVARAIVSAAVSPRRQIYVGAMGRMLSVGQRVSPRLMDFYMTQSRRLFRQQRSSTPDRGESNLYASPNESAVEGGYAGRRRLQRGMMAAGSAVLLSALACFLQRRSAQ